MVIWWSVFLIITVVFIFLNKSIKSYRTLVNYFIIQESLGLIFLIINFGLIQFFIVLIKIGVAPLHFWIFRITNNILGLNLMWFLTFQKLPFLIILLQIFYLRSFILLFLGLIICYFQMLIIKDYKNLLVISSTESFNWILVGLLISFLNPLCLFLYYIFLMFLLINKFRNLSYNRVSWETVLVFLNIPFSVTFFVKIFSLGEILKLNNMFFVVLLFLIFISALSFSYWLINISVKLNYTYQINNKMRFFLLYPLIIISIIYFSSKIYYIILIR